jgi:hypothetical protein
MEDQEFHQNYAAFQKERNTKHFYLRQNGFEYRCSMQYPLDYYNLCISLWRKYFKKDSQRFLEFKSDYTMLMSLSIEEIQYQRKTGGRYLKQPTQEKPKGVTVVIDGVTSVMKDWEEIATAGGQYDSEDE